MSAILAKVLNSTVGTENFKALDEVLRDHKILVPSEKIYAPILSDKYTASGSSSAAMVEIPDKIVFLTDGVINIYAHVTIPSSSAIWLSPTLNGEKQISSGVHITASNNKVQIITSLTVRKGDVLGIACAGPSSVLNQAYVGAEVSDSYYVVYKE